MHPDDLIELVPDAAGTDPIDLLVAPPPRKPASSLDNGWGFQIPGILRKTVARKPTKETFAAVLREECGKVSPMSQDKIYKAAIEKIKATVDQKRVSVSQAIALLTA